MQKLNIIKGITSSFMFLCVFSACTSNKTDFPNIADSKYDDLRISSNDTSLVKIFDWAVNTSDSYVGEIRLVHGMRLLCHNARLFVCVMFHISVSVKK